jgi:hypothetical protein
MEIVSILRVLRRHRLLVGVGLAFATFLALNAAYQVSFMPPKLASRQTTSGVATARVIIAARTQPAFDLKSHITDTLGVRAALLADLLSTDDVRAKIARSAGLQAGQVAVITPAMAQPTLQLALPIAGTEAAAMVTEPYVLVVTTQGAIPIITLKAAGADPVEAAKVANAATSAIAGLIATKSSGRPEILVERLGPAISRPVVGGSKRPKALAVLLVVFGVWCFGLVVAAGCRNRWRHRRAANAASAAPRYSAST